MHRLRTPDVVVGTAALVLFVSLFLPWYALGPVSASATEAFSVIDLWLVVTAFTGVWLVVVTATRTRPALPIAMDVITTWTGGVATLLVLFRVFAVPGPDGVERDLGLWVGLIAAALLTGAAFRAMRDGRSPGLEPSPVPELQPAPAP